MGKPAYLCLESKSSIYCIFLFASFGFQLTAISMLQPLSHHLTQAQWSLRPSFMSLQCRTAVARCWQRRV